MFTIGTSAIRALRQQLKDLDPVLYADVIKALGIEAPDGTLSTLRLTAFVGTLAERGNPNVEGSTILAPYSAFFVTDPATDTAQLQIPYRAGDPDNWWTTDPLEWYDIGVTFDKTFFTKFLIPAGGFVNAQYAFQRGFTNDKEYAFKIDGCPYFDKTLSELWIYNADKRKWIQISALEDKVGHCVSYPESLISTRGMPEGYLLCDGSAVSALDYPLLYDFIGDTFNYGVLSQYQFMLPKQSNTIIRVRPK
jgi:hypothetical protein